jgi:hypothetical protein
MRSLSLSCCFCGSGWEVGGRIPVFSRFIDNIKILVPNVVRGGGAVVICVSYHSVECQQRRCPREFRCVITSSTLNDARIASTTVV